MPGSNRMIRTVTLALGVRHAVSIPVPPEAILEARLVGTGKISLTYDLRQTSLPALEIWLEQSGLPHASGFWHRLNRRWLAFKDDNRRDQAAIVHKCCSVPPSKD